MSTAIYTVIAPPASVAAAAAAAAMATPVARKGDFDSSRQSLTFDASRCV